MSIAGILAAASAKRKPSPGEPPPAEAMSVVAVVPFTTPTSTGTLDITDSGQLGGRTPVGAIFVCPYHANSDGASETANATIGIGAADGTNEWVFGATSTDNVSSTNATAGRSQSNCIGFHSGTGAIGGFFIAAAFDSFITDGVRVNFGTVNAAQRTGYAILFAGDAVECAAGYMDAPGSGAVDITAPGFTPDMVVTMANGSTSADKTDGCVLNFGVGVNDGSDTCKGITWGEDDGAAAGQPFATARTNAAFVEVNENDGSYDALGTLGSYDASGFTFTLSSSSLQDMGWFAVNLGGDKARLADLSTPTSTGVDAAASGLSMGIPHFCLAALTTVETANESSPLTEDANSTCFQVSAFNSDTAKAGSLRAAYAADPTDTGTQLSDAALHLGSSSSVDDIEADLDSFVSGGVNLDYTAVNAAAKLGFMLVVGAAS